MKNKQQQQQQQQQPVVDNRTAAKSSRREAVVASELRYRRLFESAKDGILILDAETGMILDVNPYLTDLLGYSREEFLGKRLWELGFFKHLAANAEKFAELQAKEYVRYEDLPLQSMDGLKHEVEFVSNVYGEGEKRVIQCNIRDITERKRAEAYRAMTQEILYLLNEPGEWQEIVQRVVGSLKSHTESDAVGVRLQNGDDFPYYAQEGFSKDFLQTENTLLEDDKQGGVCRDATGEVCLACTCGLVLSGKSDPENPLYTLGGSAWTNDSHLQLNTPLDEERRFHPRNQCIHQGYASVALVPIRNQDRIVGLLQINDRRKEQFSLERIECLEGIASHIGSVWMRKQAEASEAVLAEQLRQSQKMEAVGRLAGGVAHDFNNMLMVIMGNVELCRDEVEAHRPIHELLDEIMNAAERSAEITRQLLTFARKQIVNPEVLNLNDAADGMLKLLRRLIGEDIALVWRPDVNLWPTKIDPIQVNQIMVNLLVNARDAIAGVGRVTLETQNVAMKRHSDFCPVDMLPGDYVMLAVSDNGRGMDAATQRNIFEPFFTTKGVGAGTGLGLATVYGIVQQNRGHIHVTSEAGKGATFRIYLPREIRKNSRATDAGTPKVESTGRGETILLVEDEKSVRIMCEKFLKDAGYVVTSVASPEKALTIASRYDASFDLLLSDVIMPGMNGQELARQLKSILPGLHALFISGYPAEVMTQRDLSVDAAFLSKPFSRSKLIEKVRAVLDAGATGLPDQETLVPRLAV